MILNGEYNFLEVEVEARYGGMKLGDFLRTELGISRKLLTLAKREDGLSINGRSATVRKPIWEGDIVRLDMSELSGIEAEEIPIEALYEDRDLLVVNKPAKLLVHPSKKHESGTLLNGLIHYARGRGESYRPHLVNRLDRDTSGIMIVAKNPYAHYELMKQMEEKRLRKKYLALVKGAFREPEGKIEYKISYEKHEGINRLIKEDGKPSFTFYKVLADDGAFALVELELLTGRTHQIRVHMSELGHPLVDDEIYGEFGRGLIGRQALHAYYLSFKSPRAGERELQVPLPEDLASFMRERQLALPEHL